MTKSTILRWCGIAALSLFCLGLAPAQDDDTQSDAQPKKEKKIPKGLKPVAKTIAEMDTFNAKPNLKAKYYIYLISASWCGPCQALMPKIVEAYPDMKKKGVEILLISADNSLDAAQKYAKSHDCQFPAVWQGDPKVKSLPGLTGGPGIPWAVFVDAKGKQIVACVASNGSTGVLKWEDVLFGKKKPKKK